MCVCFLCPDNDPFVDGSSSVWKNRRDIPPAYSITVAEEIRAKAKAVLFKFSSDGCGIVEIHTLLFIAGVSVKRIRFSL